MERSRPQPQSSLSVALVLFILTPEGKVETVGGEELTAGRMAPVSARTTDLSSIIQREMKSVLPLGTITSRMRPLMPRLRADGVVVLPVWATGRFAESEFGNDAARTNRGFAFGALERLAASLNDPSLVVEAQGEFRRALAADPVSHQLLGEATRMRALAMDELARQPSAEEMPPLLGMLPPAFTLDQLHLALNEAAHLQASDAQKSTNFRRRVVDLMQAGVLIDDGDRAMSDQRGRPAKLYRFSLRGWRNWLEGRGAEAREFSRYEQRWALEAREAPFDPRQEFEKNSFESRLPPSRLALSNAAPEGEPGAERVARLESLVRTMRDDLAKLMKPGSAGKLGDSPKE